MSYLKEFQKQITRHDYPTFLQLWEEYCNADELDSRELCEVLKAVKLSEMAVNFGRHVERILPLWDKLADEQSKFETLKLIVDVQTTNSELLAKLAYDMLQKRYGEDKLFQEKIKHVGLRSKDKFQGAISSFVLISHMQKGNYVLHSSGWGVGEILDVSFLREQLTIEFENVAGKKDLSFATAFKTLTPIQKDHILARRFGSADDLEKECKTHPVEIIKKLLHDLGPKTASEIKDELCELVIPADEWSKWWQLTRAKLKKDPVIDTPTDLKEPFRLRTQEVTSDERLKKAVEAAKENAEIIQAIYSFFRDFPEAVKDENLKNYAIDKLSTLLTEKELSNAEELQVLFLLQDLGYDKNESLLIDLVKRHENIALILQSMEILALKKKYLQEIRKHHDKWAKIFENLLIEVDYNPLRDYILAELTTSEHNELVQKALEKLVIHPQKSPEAFLWYFQKALASSKLPYTDANGKSKLLEGLLILLSHVENDPAQKTAVKKIHALISMDRFAIIRKIMQGASIADVKEFLLLATKCHSLDDHEIKIFHSLAEVVYPTLAKAGSKKSSADDLSILWCTQEGYSKLQKRVQQIATVETVENAKEIEVARAHGDLRENAEFKAALERRDRLQQELKTLSDQLNRARVISKEDVQTDEVGVGCEVDCMAKAEKKVTYILLGPWDADPEKNILSFQSKLAQSMKGLTKGDTFKFQDDEYQITDIRNHFDK